MKKSNCPWSPFLKLGMWPLVPHNFQDEPRWIWNRNYGERQQRHGWNISPFGLVWDKVFKNLWFLGWYETTMLNNLKDGFVIKNRIRLLDYHPCPNENNVFGWVFALFGDTPIIEFHRWVTNQETYRTFWGPHLVSLDVASGNLWQFANWSMAYRNSWFIPLN